MNSTILFPAGDKYLEKRVFQLDIATGLWKAKLLIQTRSIKGRTPSHFTIKPGRG